MEKTSLFKRESVCNKAFLIWKLINMKYKEGSLIIEHLKEFQSIVNQLSFTKMSLEYELQALLLFNFLPNSWENICGFS